ncbi:MAG TPA: P-loop NTPase fold protein [Solirubrobacterales bacterium]|nr:P-loop NTPase fold protein [Solirubrobacterales bacterium]
MATAPPQAGSKDDEPSQLTYPALADSPYRVAVSLHKERWWFADGIWLTQGADNSVVAFAWTQWLADRGVQTRKEELGEGFARQLYHDARTESGEDVGVDVDKGTTIRAGAEVLHERNLLEECYVCADADEAVNALLERGPLLAGLSWYTSFSEPEELDGWTVCRLDQEDSVQGTHCILLNGVQPNLKIGGVTGFVRFKNSWGTGWGDGGHALISIEDLRAASLEILLPIPPANALSPNLRQEMATEGAPYSQRQRVFERSGFDSDLWTRRDTVGAKTYADAIARGIQHLETKPPLTIGIKGAWGSGKTSLMRMIRDRLEWPDREGTADELRPIHLTRESTDQIAAPKRRLLPWGSRSRPRVTNREVLKEAKKAQASDIDPPHSDGKRPKLEAELKPPSDRAARNEPRWRPTVWFNPWAYQTGEQIWAGLAHEIIEQITARMSRWERERFWLHLNVKRIDEQAVRRRLYGLILSRIVPFAVTGLVLLVAGLVLIAAGRLEALGTILALGGPGALLAGMAFSSLRVLGSGLGTDLAGLVQPAGGIGRFAGEQLAGAYEDAVEKPDYRAQSGALYLVQCDIQRVLDLVATPDRPLVIFVDDLDRCSPNSVVQVIEAVNLFVAGAYPNTIFVIAMEPEMVAAHVEAVYGDLVEKLDSSGAAGQAFDLGWRFLEKIVQLPLSVPAMEQERTTAMFRSLFPTGAGPAHAEDHAAGNGGGKKSIDDASLSEALAIAGTTKPEPAAQEAVRKVVELRLTLEEPDVQKAMDYARGYLRHNPREIKRFVNLFRFYTMIYTERRLEGLPAPNSLSEVAKLAVLGIRWPGLLSALALPTSGGGNQTVFELLESPPRTSEDDKTPDQVLAAKLKDVGFSDNAIKRLMKPDLRGFLRDKPKIGAGVRGYL